MASPPEAKQSFFRRYQWWLIWSLVGFVPGALLLGYMTYSDFANHPFETEMRMVTYTIEQAVIGGTLGAAVSLGIGALVALVRTCQKRLFK